MFKREKREFRQKLQGETMEALRKMETLNLQTGEDEKLEITREVMREVAENPTMFPLTAAEDRTRRLQIAHSGGIAGAGL